jgi:hypothetical protein
VGGGTGLVHRLGAPRLIWIKSGVRDRAHDAPVLHRVIPIVPARPPRPVPGMAAAAEAPAPRLIGDPRRALQVLAALESAVFGHMAPAHWLREVRVEHDEACIALAPGLPPDEGQLLAQTTFDTLRRLLPDTDIYVGAARSATAH